MFFSGRDSKIVLSVGGSVYEVARARLQKYLVLEQFRNERNVAGYLEECGIPTTGPGIELLCAYRDLVRLNSPSVKIPLLIIRGQKKDDDDVPWDYLNRHIVFWVYLITSRARISLTETLSLDIDDFFALLQEVLIDEQLEKEWVYTLSEVAYQYDPSSKVSRLRPLERPVWMIKIRSKHTPKEIPVEMMPKGLVISLSRSDNASK